MTNSDSTNFINTRELIDLAITFEQESVQFYRELQAIAVNKDIIDILKLLEREEIEHEKKLKELSVSESDALIQFAPSLSLSMPAVPQERMNFDRLIELAIKREQAAEKIYNNASRHTSGELKDLLSGLAIFEKGHIDKLESLKNYY